MLQPQYTENPHNILDSLIWLHASSLLQLWFSMIPSQMFWGYLRVTVVVRWTGELPYYYSERSEAIPAFNWHLTSFFVVVVVVKSGSAMMMTFTRCMIFIQGRSQYFCGVLKRLLVTALPLENDQEAVHHHRQVMHRKSHEAQPTMNPTKEIKLQRPMKHLLSWRRSMEINIPVNNCVPGLITTS